MNDTLATFVRVDLVPLFAAGAAALSCALVGNFLVLRRESMLGDAISHAVLPGIVAAFLVADTRAGWPMFVGAAAAGIIAVLLVELVRRLGRVESGAAMGVVFPVMFAAGVVLMERAAARHVDLDASCVLYGQLETLTWDLTPDMLRAPLSSEALGRVPIEFWMLLGSLALVSAVVVLGFKELRVASFDPQLATSLGFSSRLISHALAVLVAVVTVASFKAVGSILVVAMLVCPAATARLITDRLEVQLWLSVVVSIVTAGGAYALGAFGAPAVGLPGSVNIAGSMALFAGALLAVAAVASPTHGVLARHARRRALATRVSEEDLVGTLYRAEELGTPVLAMDTLAQLMGGTDRATGAVRRAVAAGIAAREARGVTLTDAGREFGAGIIRTHRLWETYLVERAGLRADHVHDPAEVLEHARTEAGDRIDPPSTGPLDPHGHPIPDGSP